MTHTKLCAIAAVTLIAGCGGDDGATTSGIAAVSATPESRFVAEAEAICKEANAKELAAGATGIDWIHSELFTDQAFLEEFTAIGRAALADLRKLAPPEADEERFAIALGAIDKMLVAMDERRAEIRKGKDAGDALRRYEHGYTDLVAAGGPIGLTECLGIVL